MKNAVSITLTVLVSMTLLSGCSNSSSWPSVRYTEVRAYAWPDDFSTEEVVLPEMRLAPNVLNTNGAVLSAEQVRRLTVAASGKHSEHPIAGCHNPHNAFVFYNGTKAVAFVEVCFECQSTRMHPSGAAQYPDQRAMAEIFTELKLPLGKYADAAAFKTYYQKISRIR